MGKKFSTLAEECEPLWLLHMESEYISFMVSLESEMRLLHHVRGCGECRAKIRLIYTGEREPNDELEELFAIDLQEKLQNSTSILDLPLRVNHNDADAYIEARIDWRLAKLKTIITNAELELKNLSDKIKAVNTALVLELDDHPRLDGDPAGVV
jgi:hypothetical protein